MIASDSGVQKSRRNSDMESSAGSGSITTSTTLTSTYTSIESASVTSTMGGSSGSNGGVGFGGINTSSTASVVSTTSTASVVSTVSSDVMNGYNDKLTPKRPTTPIMNNKSLIKKNNFQSNISSSLPSSHPLSQPPRPLSSSSPLSLSISVPISSSLPPSPRFLQPQSPQLSQKVPSRTALPPSYPIPPVPAGKSPVISPRETKKYFHESKFKERDSFATSKTDISDGVFSDPADMYDGDSMESPRSFLLRSPPRPVRSVPPTHAQPTRPTKTVKKNHYS